MGNDVEGVAVALGEQLEADLLGVAERVQTLQGLRAESAPAS